MLIESLNNLTGFYRGTVLKHLENGFCKIWVPDVYPEEWKFDENIEKLPDAEQANLLFCASAKRNGTFSYPDLRSTVWCFFANNDPNYPVYFASTLAGPGANNGYTVIKPISNKPANTHLIKYEDTSIIINNETDGINITVKADNLFKNTMDKIADGFAAATGDNENLKFLYSILNDQNSDSIDNFGAQAMNALDKTGLVPNCTIKLQKNGNIKIESSNDIEISGKNIKIDGKNSISISSKILSLAADTQLNINTPYLKTDMRGDRLNSFVVLTNDNESQTLAGL